MGGMGGSVCVVVVVEWVRGVGGEQDKAGTRVKSLHTEGCERCGGLRGPPNAAGGGSRLEQTPAPWAARRPHAKRDSQQVERATGCAGVHAAAGAARARQHPPARQVRHAAALLEPVPLQGQLQLCPAGHVGEAGRVPHEKGAQRQECVDGGAGGLEAGAGDQGLGDVQPLVDLQGERG